MHAAAGTKSTFTCQPPLPSAIESANLHSHMHFSPQYPPPPPPGPAGTFAHFGPFPPPPPSTGYMPVPPGPPYQTYVANELRIKSLEENINTLTVMLTELQEDRSRCDKIYSDEIKNLSLQVSSLQAAQSEPRPTVDTQCLTSLQDLLIGSSLIKHIDEKQLSNTKVHCKRGARPKDITRICNLKARAGEKYETVSLLVGANRLNRSDPLSNVESTADEVMMAAQAAANIASKVRVIETPPRLTSDAMLTAVDNLNKEVEKRCTDKGYDFVNTRGDFWLANGKVNKAFIDQKDKVHLTPAGSEALLECLDIALINPADPRKGVRPDPPRPSPVEAAKKKQVLPPPPSNPKPSDIKKQRKPNQNRPRKQQVDHGNHATQFAQPMGGHTRFYQHSSSNGNGNSSPNAGHSNTQERNQWQDVNEGGRKFQRNMRTGRAASSGASTQGRSHMQARGNAREYHGGHTTPNLQQPHPPTQQTRGRNTMQNNLTQERNPQCQLCANFGHSAASCRSRSQSCYTCGQTGHFSRVCPQ